ncbi:MAG: serine/threonine-protein kinase [Armatimonadetes bacterium]|nr:serine/threonine-protein kinase [Armatimonadota bacterium]
MNNSPWRFLEGQVIEGRYHLRELLGTGSYGGVFRADEVVDDRLIRQVAIKLITSSNEISRDRQFEELSLSCQLDHSNIVRSFSVGRSVLQGGELLYIVMELANGSLTDSLSNGPLPDTEARELARHLTSALLYLHGPPRQLVHRDIKPANILRVGDAWKLSDFGTARVVGSETMVRTGPLGTAAYAPPESYDGEISRAWDVWSLGVVLAQALSGRLPFAGDTLNQLQRSVLHDPPDIPAGLSSPFGVLIQGCLVRDRRSRFAIEQVRDVLSGRRPHRSLPQMIRGTVSNAISRLPVARGLLRHRAFAWVTALLVFVVIATGLAWFRTHSDLALTMTPASFSGSGGTGRVYVPQVPAGESSSTRMELRDVTGAVLGATRMSAQKGQTTGEVHIPANGKQSPRKLELLITTSSGRQGHFTISQAGNPGLDKARALAQEAKSVLDRVEERIIFYSKNPPPPQDIHRIREVLKQQCDKACEMGNRALVLAPSSREAYLCVVQARRFSGDESGALQIARKAIQQFPGDPELQSEMDILTR